MMQFYGCGNLEEVAVPLYRADAHIKELIIIRDVIDANAHVDRYIHDEFLENMQRILQDAIDEIEGAYFGDDARYELGTLGIPQDEIGEGRDEIIAVLEGEIIRHWPTCGAPPNEPRGHLFRAGFRRQRNGRIWFNLRQAQGP